MTSNNYLETVNTNNYLETVGTEHKRGRLEYIAMEIVYGEYQRGMKKGNGVNPENYKEALDFIDLQQSFTKENFNNIVQKALKILYDIKENNDDKLRTFI